MADVLTRHRTPHRIVQRKVFRGEVAEYRTLFCTTIRRSLAKPAVFCGVHAPTSIKVSKLGLIPLILRPMLVRPHHSTLPTLIGRGESSRSEPEPALLGQDLQAGASSR